MSDIRTELLAAMAPRPGVDAATTEELAQASGRYYLAIRTELKRLIAEGKVEVVRVPRLCIDGITRHVAAYRPRE